MRASSCERPPAVCAQEYAKNGVVDLPAFRNMLVKFNLAPTTGAKTALWKEDELDLKQPGPTSMDTP